MSSTPVVQAAGLSIGYGTRTVVADCDLTLAPASQTVLTGRSGAGKTTLLLALAGLLAPDVGAVSWPGLDHEPTRRRSQIGLAFQAPSLVPDLTALENVQLPMRLHGVDRRTAREQATAALADLDLVDVAAALPEQLSGGQRQRVALARALAGRPLLLLADEPTGALPRSTAQQVFTLLHERCRALGTTLLVATHDPHLTTGAHRRIELDDGRLREGLPV